uniref:Uncharacterized protein n=1 Tax=Phenylobacterium glaciei TaxID=2803784 RepID=A0A974P2U5_9CAUL|nr:hypothetical protein JKL49_20505 [Phenylobacterium glaciei]
MIGSGDWGRLESSTAYVRHAYSSLYDASAALNLYGSSTADLGVFEEYTKVDMVVEDAVLTSPATAGCNGSPGSTAPGPWRRARRSCGCAPPPGRPYRSMSTTAATG